jgi:hypothetical protein
MKFNFAHACVQKTKNITKDESSFQVQIENLVLETLLEMNITTIVPLSFRNSLGEYLFIFHFFTSALQSQIS